MRKRRGRLRRPHGCEEARTERRPKAKARPSRPRRGFPPNGSSFDHTLSSPQPLQSQPETNKKVPSEACSSCPLVSPSFSVLYVLNAFAFPRKRQRLNTGTIGKSEDTEN